jgi:uncharacterized protein YjbI with pentapeptide repeats
MAEPERRELHADCARCVGLCCVALEFAASADFAIDKPAGRPCPHLQMDFRCAIHSELRRNGFPGCAVYDCFGAGQHVSQVTFAGVDWRGRPDLAPRMFTAFGFMRQLHELLWYLSEALALESVQALYPELRFARLETERLSDLDRVALIDVDVAAHRERVNALLRQASALARADVRPRGIDRSAADLVGKDLRRMNLRGANLRGARLIGAKLSGTDLALADFTGADLRGADLRAANMDTSLFVTQSQLESSVGDMATRVPTMRVRPKHWS